MATCRRIHLPIRLKHYAIGANCIELYYKVSWLVRTNHGSTSELVIYHGVCCYFLKGKYRVAGEKYRVLDHALHRQNGVGDDLGSANLEKLMSGLAQEHL